MRPRAHVEEPLRTSRAAGSWRPPFGTGAVQARLCALRDSKSRNSGSPGQRKHLNFTCSSSLNVRLTDGTKEGHDGRLMFGSVTRSNNAGTERGRRRVICPMVLPACSPTAVQQQRRGHKQKSISYMSRPRLPRSSSRLSTQDVSRNKSVEGGTVGNVRK